MELPRVSLYEQFATEPNELLEKIKVCVSFDLIGDGSPVRFEDMNIINKTRFIKQSNRLYDACMLIPPTQDYINERYHSIMYPTK
jgi:hypothetical protein